MTVAELLDRMTSRELSEWMAFYNLEPFGEFRSDLRAGMVASPLCNLWIGKGRRTKPSDWIMSFEPPEPQSGEQMKSALAALAQSRRRKGR